jgi:hypothetical protein
LRLERLDQLASFSKLRLEMGALLFGLLQLGAQQPKIGQGLT